MGVYSPKSAIQPAKPKSIMFLLIRSLYLWNKVRYHWDVFKIKDPPNPSRVDAIAIRRNFRHVHRCDGEVTKVLLELEIKQNHIGVKYKSTCEPFSNFSQLSSWKGKQDNFWPQKENSSFLNFTHCSRLGVNISVNVEMSRYIGGHFHSFRIQVPKKEKKTVNLWKKERTTWSRCPGSDTRSHSTSNSRKPEFQSRWQFSRTSLGSTCRQP